MTDLADRHLTAPRIVVLGLQGSGKGEQCGRLARRLGLDHLSTGELLRDAARAGSDLGRASETYLVRGEPVPDHVVGGLVAIAIVLLEESLRRRRTRSPSARPGHAEQSSGEA